MLSPCLRLVLILAAVLAGLVLLAYVGPPFWPGLPPPSSGSLPSPNRKLLQHGGAKRTNRIGETCSKDDIMVYQGATTALPNGIPTYTVEIMNVCVSGCAISRIHLSCGWFSSARMVNPKLFKRVRYNDCLVNDGAPLATNRVFRFEYANTFRYPLSVSSITCLSP